MVMPGVSRPAPARTPSWRGPIESRSFAERISYRRGAIARLALRILGGALTLSLTLQLACGSEAVTGPIELPDEFDAGVGSGLVAAITQVRVVVMDEGRIAVGQTVVIEEGRVAWVGPSHQADVPESAVVIEAEGAYLLPGLADMHVHLSRADIPDYIANGITTVRNMWGHPAIRMMQSQVEGGTLMGPTIYSTSPGLDQEPVHWPYTRLVPSRAEAVPAVEEQDAAGWTTLKLYQDLTPAVYDAIVAAAKARGLDFVGHVPHQVGLDRVLTAGQRSIEHLGGYDLALNGGVARGAPGWVEVEESLMPELAARTQAAGAWNCPTLAIVAQIASRFGAATREPAVANRRKMLRALHEAGARLLLGTDSGIDIVEPGVSFHEELAEWLAAGLTPYEALRAATVDAAEFLGASDDFGRVAVGLRADLVLTRGNPLESPGTLQEPLGVMVRGHWLPRP